MPGKDTKTRYQGVFARHQKHCAIANGRACNCKPSYYGVVWDRARNRTVKTKRLTTVNAAWNARIDLIKQLCNEQRRPRCVASIPKIQKLLAEARAKGVTVIYTLFPSPSPATFPNPVIGDYVPALAPKGDEPVVTSFVDKFILRDKDTDFKRY